MANNGEQTEDVLAAEEVVSNQPPSFTNSKGKSICQDGEIIPFDKDLMNVNTQKRNDNFLNEEEEVEGRATGLKGLQKILQIFMENQRKLVARIEA